MKPTVGRIVHYTPEWAGPGQPWAKPLPAIITEVLTNETVRLGVFGGSGYYPARAIHLEPSDSESNPGVPVPGCWFWPPREG